MKHHRKANSRDNLSIIALAIAAAMFTLPIQTWSATLSSKMPLTLHGIGPIHIGMKLTDAEKAIGDKLPSEYISEDKVCGYAAPQRGPKGISFMLNQDRIVRIDIDNRAFKTERGARIGDTEERIKALYPGASVVGHKYDPEGHYIEVAPSNRSDRGYLLLFETDGKRVTTFRSGRTEEVGLVEHCF